jgi:PilZ domain
VEKVITMTGQPSRDTARLGALRDRRYTIRYPFAADAEMIDMESGKQLTGITSDISLGGCFICTSKPFPLNTRGRLRLSRKGEVLDAMVIVRIVKPRIGVGVEFFDLEPPHDRVLSSWIAGLRKNR